MLDREIGDVDHRVRVPSKACSSKPAKEPGEKTDCEDDAEQIVDERNASTVVFAVELSVTDSPEPSVNALARESSMGLPSLIAGLAGPVHFGLMSCMRRAPMSAFEVSGYMTSIGLK